jgi:hypothetical protein
MGPAPQARHDSPADAAAAKASAFAGKSQRAEAVALWLTRLNGPTPHLEFMQALEKAGLDAARAEAEVVRMLACDILFEPQAGRYALVESAT